MKKSMGFSDSVFVFNETRSTPQHMAGLMVFKKPPKCGANFISELFDSLRSFPVKCYPYNARLASGLKEKILPAIETVPAEDTVEDNYGHSEH